MVALLVASCCYKVILIDTSDKIGNSSGENPLSLTVAVLKDNVLLFESFMSNIVVLSQK